MSERFHFPPNVFPANQQESVPMTASSPAKQLADARQKLVAELDKAWQTQANAKDALATAQREVTKWDPIIEGLTLALNALGPAPTRGRKPANGAAVQKPKRAPKAVLRDPAAASLSGKQADDA